MSLLKTKRNIYEKTKPLLDKAQDHLKTDVVYLIKNEFYLMTEKGINIAIAFLMALVWANWVSPETYGSYQYILAVISTVSVFALPGLSIAIPQAVSRGFDGILMRGFKTRIKWGLLGSAAILIMAAYHFFKGPRDILWSLAIAAPLFPWFIAYGLYLSFLAGKKLFNIQVKFSLITQILATAILAIAIFISTQVFDEIPNSTILFIIIATYLISRTFLQGFFFYKTKKQYVLNEKEDPNAMSYGKHLTAAGILSLLVENLDVVLLLPFAGPEQTAIYAFATAIPNQFKSFLKQIGLLGLPKFAARETHEIKKNLFKKILYLTAIMSAGIGAYIIAAPWLFRFFFPKYIASIPYSQVYALSVIPICFAFVETVFQAKMMKKQIYQIGIIIPVVRAALLIALIPIYGVWGAVIGVLITRIFKALLHLSLAKAL